MCDDRQGLVKLGFPKFERDGRFVKELKKTLIKVIGEVFSLDKLFHRWIPASAGMTVLN